MRGLRKESGLAGDMPSGEGAFEGQANGLTSNIGQDGRRGERCPSPSMKNRMKKKKKSRGKDRRERSRALSCRPGSQIRTGLRSGVDCVKAFSVGE